MLADEFLQFLILAIRIEMVPTISALIKKSILPVMPFANISRYKHIYIHGELHHRFVQLSNWLASVVLQVATIKVAAHKVWVRWCGNVCTIHMQYILQDIIKTFQSDWDECTEINWFLVDTFRSVRNRSGKWKAMVLINVLMLWNRCVTNPFTFDVQLSKFAICKTV